MDIGQLISSLHSNASVVGGISVDTLFLFISTARRLVPVISVLERLTPPAATAPLDLPAEVVAFLSDALSISEAQVLHLWESLRDVVWAEDTDQTADLFIRHGHASTAQFSYEDFYPPTSVCTNAACSRHAQVLTEPRRYPVTFFSKANGARPAYTTSLYCRGCYTRYYHNYRVQEHEDAASYRRIYYDGPVPDEIEVGMHVFVAKELCELFKSMAVFSAVSATSCSRIYNSTINHSPPIMPDWPTNFTMRTETVLDMFDLFSLLQHCEETGRTLDVWHDAPSPHERLKEAMMQRNREMAGTGQEMYGHTCKICLQFKMVDGLLCKLQAAITDGTAVGRFCCGIHDCQRELLNHRGHFCSLHMDHAGVCCVEGCHSPAQFPRRTCSALDHRSMEEAYRERGRAMFQLRARLQRAGIVPPMEVFAGPVDEEQAEFGDVDDNEEFAAPGDGACDDKPESGNRRLRARFGRRRTHNEQLVVRPCGVILSRATFYGSEAVSDVAVFLQAVFPTSQSLPEVIFFDNNCKMKRHLEVIGNDHFSNCALPVDVFHFKSKHKESDGPCNRECNPALFPDLYDDNGNWRFNSSAAEQTNVWFGGFQAIVREMLPVRYDFFLDEMIKQRNRFIVAELERRGQCPVVVPRAALFGDA